MMYKLYVKAVQFAVGFKSGDRPTSLTDSQEQSRIDWTSSQTFDSVSIVEN